MPPTGMPSRRRTAVPVVVLSLAFLAGACGSDDESVADDPGSMAEGSADDHMDDHGRSSDIAEGARSIEVTADSLRFDPATLAVDAGEDLAVVLTAGDILHDFTIDELDAHVAADRGETAEGGFTATEPGTYTYYCSVPGHRAGGMEGTLVVE